MNVTKIDSVELVLTIKLRKSMETIVHMHIVQHKYKFKFQINSINISEIKKKTKFYNIDLIQFSVSFV